jgi:hypothetical protein
MIYEPPKHIEESLIERIESDLKPSFLTVQTKVGASAIIGGVLSLFVCGQFGIGFTSFAEAFSQKIHANMDPFACALICGATFAIFPVLILRLFLCHPLQFKAIVYKQRPSVLFWYGGFGSLLAYFSHHGNNLYNYIGWVIAALFMTHLLSMIVNKIMPVWNFKEKYSSLLIS